MDNGVNLRGLHYLRSTPGEACPVSYGGREQWTDVLGLTTVSPEMAPAISEALAELFPLEPGKRARAVAIGQGSRDRSAWILEFEVLRRERAVVPAGSYEAAVVRVKESGMAGNTYRGERVVWLQPEINRPLRVMHRVFSGVGSGVDWEATGFRFNPI
jgi:hypothetical protein